MLTADLRPPSPPCLINRGIRHPPRRDRERAEELKSAREDLERVKREKAEEARKAEARSAAAEEKVSEARANEEQAYKELQGQKDGAAPLHRRNSELSTEVESLKQRLKAAEQRSDALTHRLAEERNRVLKLKFHSVMGDAGSMQLAGAPSGSAGADVRHERHQVKRLLASLMSKIARESEAWRSDE